MGKLCSENVNSDKNKSCSFAVKSLQLSLVYVKKVILTSSNLGSLRRKVFYLDFFSNWDKDDWVAWYLQSQEARITNSQPVISTCSEHRRTQAFYQTGDAQQLCRAETMLAFLAADIAAFKKAQQPARHAIWSHRRA